MLQTEEGGLEPSLRKFPSANFLTRAGTIWTQTNRLIHATEEIDLVSLAAEQGFELTGIIDVSSNGWAVAKTNSGPVLMLFLEFLNAEKTPAANRTFSNFLDPGVLGGPAAPEPFNIEHDSARFYIRVPQGAAFESISLKVSTKDKPEPEYDDSATQIDLEAYGSHTLSKSMVLVSDDVDDDIPVDGVADNSPNDRTFKAQLSGNFTIEAIKIGSGSWAAMSGRITIPARKNVNLAVAILRNRAEADGGTEVVPEPTVKQDLKLERERYAQAGISLSWAIDIVDPPAEVDLSDGLETYANRGQSDPELTNLFARVLQNAGPSDISVYYVNYINEIPRPFGISFTDTIWGTLLGGNVVIPAIRHPFTVARELGHILLDTGEHQDNSYQLMRDNGTSEINEFWGSKRFTIEEINTLQGSRAYASKNPRKIGVDRSERVHIGLG
jgi:hypothetical protein